MKSRESATGHGDKQQWKEIVALCSERRERLGRDDHRCGHGGPAVHTHNEDAYDSTGDHRDHHDGREIVSWLLEHLDGYGTGKHEIDHYDGNPAATAQVQRKRHAERKHEGNKHDRKGKLPCSGELEPAARPAKRDGDKGKENRDRTCGTGRIGLGDVDGTRLTNGRFEGARNHRGEGSDNDATKEPDEEQKQTAPRSAYILLDEQPQGLSVVLDRGVQGAKVMYGAKEHAADDHPQKHR